MEYAIMGLVVIAVVATGIILYLKSKKSSMNIALCETQDLSGLANTQVATEDGKMKELVIQMEILPAEAIPDENKLVELTDSKVLAHINNLIPGLAQVGNMMNNAVQAANPSNEVLYRALFQLVRN